MTAPTLGERFEHLYSFSSFSIHLSFLPNTISGHPYNLPANMARYRKKSQRVISQVLESFWSPQFFYKETPKTFDGIESHYHSPADTTSTPTQWGTDSKAEQTNSGYRRYAKADRKAPSPQSCKATIWSESTPKTLESMLVEYEQHQAQDSKVETTVVSIDLILHY